MRFELTTSTLARLRSTPELHPLFTHLSAERTVRCRGSDDFQGKNFRIRWQAGNREVRVAPHFSGMKKFGNKLDEILADKAEEVRRLLPVREKLQFAAQAREDFRSFEIALGGAIRDHIEDEGYGLSDLAVIAEVKRTLQTGRLE